jgi:hypothetical protein
MGSPRPTRDGDEHEVATADEGYLRRAKKPSKQALMQLVTMLLQSPKFGYISAVAAIEGD